MRHRLLALLLVAVLVAAPVAFARDTWPAVQRIVAIGDIHGDYDQFVAVMKAAGLVDDQLNWTGGETHLVQTGDVPDRGPDTRKVLDLLMKLERQARRAGGFVHPLIGNHEAMNVYGDLRYVSPEEFAAFRDSNSERVRDSFYRQYQQTPEGRSAGADRAKWEAEHPLGYYEHRQAWGPRGRYGQWVREHNAVMRIGDTLFLHGGISPAYADRAIGWINSQIRQELDDFSLLNGGVTMAEDGPLWYRGLASDDEATLAGHVDHVLQSFGAKRIVIGHTPTDGTVVPRFGGKVLQIDVGLSAYYGGHTACLIIEDGETFVLRGETREPLSVAR
jgi:hypothetical protein